MELALVSRRIVIAYWLIPAEPAHSFFQGAINDLARRYHAPLFVPHVTIHVGANHFDAAELVLPKAARECQSITVKALGIDHSDEFIKTLFVRFVLNAKLQQLNTIVRLQTQSTLESSLQKDTACSPIRTGRFDQRAVFGSCFRYTSSCALHFARAKPSGRRSLARDHEKIASID
ncbi:MAG: hypothetical protein DMF31_12420 [Verrucomicrobia bacterium]|nr:MAG: hypothetical protein DMF31_12420 [Verrucomicrobiota bacterium]